MGAINNMLTGKDNKTHDIMRFSVYIVALLFPVLVLWGIIMVTWAAISGKPFDLMAAYQGFAMIIAAFGTFLITGAGAIFMKRSTEPDQTAEEKPQTPPNVAQ